MRVERRSFMGGAVTHMCMNVRCCRGKIQLVCDRNDTGHSGFAVAMAMVENSNAFLRCRVSVRIMAAPVDV